MSEGVDFSSLIQQIDKMRKDHRRDRKTNSQFNNNNNNNNNNKGKVVPVLN
jgi:hypothetical protein